MLHVCVPYIFTSKHGHPNMYLFLWSNFWQKKLKHFVFYESFHIIRTRMENI